MWLNNEVLFFRVFIIKMGNLGCVGKGDVICLGCCDVVCGWSCVVGVVGVVEYFFIVWFGFIDFLWIYVIFWFCE